jgi:hypothetical protein
VAQIALRQELERCGVHHLVNGVRRSSKAAAVPCIVPKQPPRSGMLVGRCNMIAQEEREGEDGVHGVCVDAAGF